MLEKVGKDVQKWGGKGGGELRAGLGEEENNIKII
jgi:hypothetical protein